MRSLCVISILCLCGLLKAQNRLIFASDGKQIHLRWAGDHAPNVSYAVYRRPAGVGEWKKLNASPLQPVWGNADLKRILKYKHAVYLSLFGVPADGNINSFSWDSTFKKQGAESFMGAMSLLNPEYARALGEMWSDVPPDITVYWDYRVTLIKGGTETELGLAEKILPMKASVVPEVNDLEALPGNRSVKLSWSKDKARMGSGEVVTWQIFRSDSLLGEYIPMNFFGVLSLSSGNMVSSKESYEADHLENGRTYYFKVRAVNAFGMLSNGGSSVSATPSDPARMNPPKNAQTSVSGNLGKLSWEESRSISVYRSLTRKGPYTKIYPPKYVYPPESKVWYDEGVAEGKEYWYYLRTLNEEGMEGPTGDTLHLMVPDVTPPLAPTNVKAVSKKGLITITWDANKEPDILGYEVERASDQALVSRFLLTKKPITALTFRDSLGYKSQTQFAYFVYAIDKSYNRSRASQRTLARMPDFDPPAAPLIILLAENDSGVLLTWKAPPAKDLAGYRVYRKAKGATVWEKKLETSKLKAQMPVQAGTYTFAVTAVDSAKNESPQSIPQTLIAKADRSMITPVAGKLDTSGGKVRISWKPATGATPKGWAVTRINGDKRIEMATIDAKTLNFLDAYPAKGKNVYEIRAHNSEYVMGRPLIIEYIR